MNMRALYRLTKPGVTYGNLLTAVAGYLFAAGGNIDWTLLLALTVGTWGVIASACVINNYLDQDIDAKMDRTKKRPLITGEVTARQALVFGAMLGIGGILLLALFTNAWVVAAGAAGWIVYVWLYGALSKRMSLHGTLVGAISGAVPILAGYLAARGFVDTGAVLVFAVLFFWQMPEFYSIALFRKKEYAAAQIPLISIVKGESITVRHIFLHTVGFVVSALLLYVYKYTGTTYAVVMGIGSAYWLYLAGRGFVTNDIPGWARRMFRYSLIMLLVFSLMISIDIMLP